MDVDLLAKPLDRERVKERAGGNGRSLAYLETHDVIRTANTVFGFGQWGHRITELRCLGNVTVHNSDQKPGVQVGYLCAVELTVDGCQTTAGVGYGDAVEYRESALVTAHELAAKEAESDALKRALKNYGDQFGLALYDKAQAHVTGDPQAQPATWTPGAAAPAAGNGSSGGAASEKQIGFLNRLLADRGHSIGDIGKPVDQLTKAECSKLIEDLKNGVFEPVTLDAVLAGGGDIDLDIPFLPTI